MTASFAWHPPRRRRDRLAEAAGWVLSFALATSALAGALVWAERRAGATDGEEAAILLELDPLPPVAAVPAPPPSPPASAIDPPKALLPDADEPLPDLPKPEAVPMPAPEAPATAKASADLLPEAADPPPPLVTDLADPTLAGARPRARPDRPELPQPQPQAPAQEQATMPSETAAAPAQPPSTAVSRAGAADAQAQWGAAIRKKVERRKAYPKAARGAEGEVIVKRTISRAGTLESVSVARSSGNAVLDEAAMSAVRRAGRFPAAPQTLTGARHVFSLPIRFAP